MHCSAKRNKTDFFFQKKETKQRRGREEKEGEGRRRERGKERGRKKRRVKWGGKGEGSDLYL